MACSVQLEIYNTLGERITQLVNEKKDAGCHEVRWSAANQSSGVYIYAIRAKDESGAKEFMKVRKMLIMK